MDRYVVTGFNEYYWHQWGVSWIASLKELAKFDENILVVDFGLSQITKNKLIEYGAYLLPGVGSDFRVGIFNAILDFSKKYPGIFAIWDADVYFQSNIIEIFGQAKNNLLITKNPGFYAGTHEHIQTLSKIQTLVSHIQNAHFFDCLKNYFPQLYLEVDDSWNFTDVAQNIDDKKVIHPTGDIKKMFNNQNIAFWERHKDIYNKYAGTYGVKRLLKFGCSSNKI